MSLIHIGEKIKSVFQEKGISVSEFSRKISTSRENVYGIFRRDTIDTGLLLRISIVLDHDFFIYYSNEINPERLMETERLKDEIVLLKQLNQFLNEKLNG